MIRNITLDDAQNLRDISKSLLSYLFEAQPPAWFENTFDTDAFKERILSPNYKHFAYMIDNEIVGFIAIRDDDHLYHLFVKEKYHQQNIAKQLWNFVKSNVEFKTMNTNASMYAVEVYKSFGFVINEKSKWYKQLEYQPMIYSN